MPADSMPSNGKNIDGEKSNNDSIFGTSPGVTNMRARTESGSSDHWGEVRYVLPSLDGSPPKLLTLDEYEGMTKNLQKMELVHELVLNPDFMLKPYEPPENSLERRIKDVMHKAFWDVLREQLQREPPCFDQAIALLTEIKQSFHEIIPTKNKRAFEHINEMLDEALIRQQAEQGVLNFKAYAEFIIQLLAKNCAPVRDEEVAKLAQIEDVVETFKAILDVMALMKLDLANYLMQSARNQIIANSVEYEKQKFKETLAYYKFGFPATEKWLKRHCTPNSDGSPGTINQTLSNAYLELMDWDEANEFPELLSIDKQRILKLGQRGKRLCVCVSLNLIASAHPIISQRPENRMTIAKDFQILLQDVTNENEISEALPNIWEHIKAKINEFLTKEGQPKMDEATENQFKAQVLQLGNKDSPVRTLTWKRLQTYYRLVTRVRDSKPPPPPGCLEYKDELDGYVNALRMVIKYNHSVFGEYFAELLSGQQNSAHGEGATTTTASNVGASAENE